MNQPPKPPELHDSSPYHSPVMFGEVVEAFSEVPSGVVADVTAGGGGHSFELLQARTDLRLLALDRDAEAVSATRKRLENFDSRVVVAQSTFSRLRETLAWVGENYPGFQVQAELVGILADLGVSSRHFDSPERGFSLRAHGPLDMRMDQSDLASTAADIVNTYSEEQLTLLFRANGESRLAQRYSRAIIAHRPIVFTDELAELIEAVTPAPARRGRIHPATRVFQALRIETNQEIDQLESLLGEARSLLAPRGVFAVISYHSGEDRLVKRHFRAASQGECTCPPRLPCVCGSRPWARELFRKARVASDAEIAANPRSRSAHLRALVKLDEQPELIGGKHG